MFLFKLNLKNITLKLLMCVFSVCTQSFLEEIQHSQYVSEQNSHLPIFCLGVEKIFNTGLLVSVNSIGFIKHVDAWSLLDKISCVKDEIITYAFRSSVENVKLHKNVLTKVGKLRLLIRYCLVSKCLHVPVEYLVSYFFLS